MHLCVFSFLQFLGDRGQLWYVVEGFEKTTVKTEQAIHRRISNLLPKRSSTRSILLRHILDRFHPGWPAHVCGNIRRASLRLWISPDAGSDGELLGHSWNVNDQPMHRVLATGVGPGVRDWNRQWMPFCAEHRLPTGLLHREKSISDGNCGFW